MLHFVQHDKPGRSLVIVDGTVVTQHHMWLLPSPARARRACPLPGQRLSIFSILGPERAKKLSIGVHGFAEKQRKSTASGQGEGRKWTRRWKSKNSQILRVPRAESRHYEDRRILRAKRAENNKTLAVGSEH